MVYPPLPPCALVENWLERHRGPVSFALHMVGIPPTILGVLLVPVYLFGSGVPEQKPAPIDDLGAEPAPDDGFLSTVDAGSGPRELGISGSRDLAQGDGAR